MNSAARQTWNILLVVIGAGGLVIAALAYSFWPSIMVLADPRQNGANSIPSESMAPTLMPGDRVVRLTTDPAAMTRGMVVVFKMPGGDRVSRIAGLPGDTVEMRKGIVYINGQPSPQRPIGPGPVFDDKTPSAMLSERFPGETQSHRMLDRGETMQDDFDAATIPQGQLFMLSDNRDNAADSRFPIEESGVGLIAFRQVAGRIESVYWAKDRGRIGKPIDR